MRARSLGQLFNTRMGWALAMKLDQALHILVSVHTRDDDVTGFVVKVGAQPDPFEWSRSQYLEAWEVVRRHLRMQTEPAKQKI